MTIFNGTTNQAENLSLQITKEIGNLLDFAIKGKKKKKEGNQPLGNLTILLEWIFRCHMRITKRYSIFLD